MRQLDIFDRRNLKLLALKNGVRNRLTQERMAVQNNFRRQGVFKVNKPFIFNKLIDNNDIDVSHPGDEGKGRTKSEEGMRSKAREEKVGQKIGPES